MQLAVRNRQQFTIQEEARELLREGPTGEEEWLVTICLYFMNSLKHLMCILLAITGEQCIVIYIIL